MAPNTNFAELPITKWLFCINLQVIYDRFALDSSYFCVYFSREI